MKIPSTTPREIILRFAAKNSGGTFDFCINALSFSSFTTWRSSEGYPIPPDPSTDMGTFSPLNNTPLTIPQDYTPDDITATFVNSTTPQIIGYQYVLKISGSNNISNWSIGLDTSTGYILITAPSDTTIRATALVHYDGNTTIPLFYISHDDLIINETRTVIFYIKNEFYVPQYYLQTT